MLAPALLVVGATAFPVALSASAAVNAAVLAAQAGGQCGAPPVSPASLVAILREPAPEDPEAEDPRGHPIPPGERATLGDLIGAWSGCLASGEVTGLLGLFTPDGIRRQLADRSPYIGGPSGMRVSILALSDVERLRDGRLAARVSIDPSGSGTAAPETLIVVIEQGQDGVWRIDHLRAPEGPVGAAGAAERDPDAPPRALLRRPIAPGPGVPVQPPGPTVAMRGADLARTGIQIGPGPAEEPAELWRTPTGWHSDAQPVTARGLVFFGGFSLSERTPLLAGVDAASGGVRWQTTAPVAWAEFPESPALGGEILFAPVQAPVAGIMAVLAASGEALWFAPFGFTSVTAPATDADAVFTAGWGVRNARDRIENDTSGAVYALDQRTGRERWRFLAPARFGAVAVGPETVYAPSDRGLFALDRASGRKKWQARFSPGAGETATVARDAVVFAGSEITSGARGIFALDAASGALRWRIDLPAVAGARAGTAVANDVLVVAWWDAPPDDPGRGIPTLRAYDLASGEERWIFHAGDLDSDNGVGTGWLTAPVISGNAALFGVAVRVPASESSGNANGLYAVDLETGALRWHAAASEPIRAAPAVLAETIYAMGGLRARGGATGGNLFAFGVR